MTPRLQDAELVPAQVQDVDLTTAANHVDRDSVGTRPMTIRLVCASVLVAALGFLIAGCGLGPDTRTFAGGYPIAASMCPADQAQDWWCEAAIAFARSSLDAGHAPIASTAAFAADWRGPDGQRINRIYGTSAADGVIVFGLADGSTHAYWVECLVGPLGHTPTAGDAICMPASKTGDER